MKKIWNTKCLLIDHVLLKCRHLFLDIIIFVSTSRSKMVDLTIARQLSRIFFSQVIRLALMRAATSSCSGSEQNCLPVAWLFYPLFLGDRRPQTSRNPSSGTITSHDRRPSSLAVLAIAMTWTRERTSNEYYNDIKGWHGKSTCSTRDA